MMKGIAGKALIVAAGVVTVLGATRPALAIQCAIFARDETGVKLHGDAWTWWAKARAVYPRGERPEPGSILVFKRHGDMRHGHVAVVTRVVSRREIRVDHANWADTRSARGKVFKDVAVRDVSPDNDWSMVRVWYTPGHTFGTHDYPTYGFIYADDRLAEGRRPRAIRVSTGGESFPIDEARRAELQTRGKARHVKPEHHKIAHHRAEHHKIAHHRAEHHKIAHHRPEHHKPEHHEMARHKAAHHKIAHHKVEHRRVAAHAAHSHHAAIHAKAIHAKLEHRAVVKRAPVRKVVHHVTAHRVTVHPASAPHRVIHHRGHEVLAMRHAPIHHRALHHTALHHGGTHAEAHAVRARAAAPHRESASRRASGRHRQVHLAQAGNRIYR